MFIREKQFDGIPTTPLKLVLTLINQTVQGRVQSGPFTGMQYGLESIESAHYPKLLGTYELELYRVIEELCNMHFDKVVNVGAGEGYYSVGFAMRNHQVKVIAFEPNVRGRKLIKELARLNGVENQLTVKGLCDIPALEESLGDEGRCLLLMDCEGGESILLDPRVCPRLKNATIIVELHEFHVPGVESTIRSRFDDTHFVTELWTRPRTVMDFPLKFSALNRILFKRELLEIMYENRQLRMKFLYLKPKNYNVPMQS